MPDHFFEMVEDTIREMMLHYCISTIKIEARCDWEADTPTPKFHCIEVSR